MTQLKKLKLGYLVLYIATMIFATIVLFSAIADYNSNNIGPVFFGFLSLTILAIVTVISYFFFVPFKKKESVKESLQTEQIVTNETN